MNKSQNDAIILAERINEARKLATQGNQNSYNWNSLVQLFSYVGEPEAVAEDLLFVYFEFTNLLAQQDQDYSCGSGKLSAGLDRLRSLYEAIRNMLNKDEALVQIAPITELR